MPDAVYFPLSEIADTENWPLASLTGEAFEKVWVTGPSYDAATQTGRVGVLLDGEVALRVPGLDFLSLALGSAAGAVNFELVAAFEPFAFGVRAPLTLRVDANLLRPIKAGTVAEPDAAAQTLDIHLGEVDLRLSGEGEVDVAFAGAVQVPRCMIGTSGVILGIGALRWLGPTTANLPPNTPPGFTGLYLDDVEVEIAGLPRTTGAIRMDDVFLGSTGFSGRVAWSDASLAWVTSGEPRFQGALAGELLGFKGGVSRIDLEFRQWALTRCEILADVFAPFLGKRIGLTLGLDGVGGLTATAGLPRSLPPEAGVAPGGPGYLLHLDVANVLALDVDSLTLAALPEGVQVLSLSGRVDPNLPGLEIPPLDLRGLEIDSRGHVRLPGGWLDVRERYTLDFHGFRLEISKLGFGNTADGGKWIGFTGGIKLVEGLPAGASAEGLRLTWYEDGRAPAITLDGVGVEFAVPEVLRFKGAVSYVGATNRFTGAIELDLIALGIQIDGTLVVAPDHFAVYLAAELPAGIPLFSTGLALYGMAGLFAYQMEPGRRPDEAWYETPAGQPGWYKRAPVGVTDLAGKWAHVPGSLALGAGVTLGTVADNGFTFSGNTLLVIVFPGPVLLVEGKASLLRERATLDAEPTLRALAVLDGRAGNLLVNLDAHYVQAQHGELIDVTGSAEAFFDFHRADAWHLYLGQKEPRERRVRARLFQLFEANAYVMLDAGKLALGAWIGYQGGWTFGPLAVTFEAWMEGNAVVSIKPAHFYGDLWLHGKVQASAFGIGVALTADARIAADVFDPFHVRGDIAVTVDLPWPFADISVAIPFEWGPNPVPPAIAPPLQEVAVEHFKVTTSWPLPRVARDGAPPLLLPAAVDTDGDGVPDAPAAAEEAAALAAAPVVPLDARPHVTFARPVHDRALAGVNAQPVSPEWERVGDPAKNEGPARVRYALERVALHKRVGGGWVLAGQTRAAAGQPRLYGSWAPVPSMPSGGGDNPGQVKLWLWSKTPYDYTRHAGRGWDDWVSEHLPEYPCPTSPETPPDVSCSIDAVERIPVQSGWVGTEYSEIFIRVYWSAGPNTADVPGWLARLASPVDGLSRVLGVPAYAGARPVDAIVRLDYIRARQGSAVTVRLGHAIPFVAHALVVRGTDRTQFTMSQSGFGDRIEFAHMADGWIIEVKISYDVNHDAARAPGAHPPPSIDLLDVTRVGFGDRAHDRMHLEFTTVAAVANWDGWACPDHPIVQYRRSREEYEGYPIMTYFAVARVAGQVAGFTDALRIEPRYYPLT